jgi:lipopolysaccharide exporter
MVKIIKNKNSFLGNVLTLLTGNTFAQLLPVIVSPIITRLYTPEEFGEFGLFVAVLGVLSVIACMKYDQAIILPADDTKAINIFALALFFATLFSVLLFMVVLLLDMLSYNFLGLSKLIWVIPFGIFIIGIFQALLNWSIRCGKFTEISLSQVYKSSTIVFGQIGIASLINGYSIFLIASHLAGQLIAVSVIFKKIWADLLKQKDHINSKSMKEQLIKYKKFPVFYSFSALLNTASVQLPLFMFAFYFNPVTLGFYTLANRVLAAPIAIIGTAIAQPFLQKAAIKHQEGNLGVFSLDVFKILLSIGLVPMTLFTMIAPEVFSLIFGDSWITAGKYVQLISSWLLLVFISSPISHIFTILELQKESLNFNLILFLSRIFVLIIGGLIGNDLLTIALFGLTGTVLWLYQIIWLLRKTEVKVSTTLRTLWVEIIKSIPYISILITLKLLSFDDLILIIGALVTILLFGFIKYRKFILLKFL